MSEIALFHSALGLRPSEHAFADRLRTAGPDYDEVAAELLTERTLVFLR